MISTVKKRKPEDGNCHNTRRSKSTTQIVNNDGKSSDVTSSPPAGISLEAKHCVICNKATKIDEKLIKCTKKGHARLSEVAQQKSDARLMKLLTTMTAKETQFHPSCYKNYNRSRNNRLRSSEEGALSHAELTGFVAETEQETNPEYDPSPRKRVKTSDTISSEYVTGSSGAQNVVNLNSPVSSMNLETKRCIICDRATKKMRSTSIAEKLIKFGRKGHARLRRVAVQKNDTRLMKLLSSIQADTADEAQFHPSCYGNYVRSKRYYSGAQAVTDPEPAHCNVTLNNVSGEGDSRPMSDNVEVVLQSSRQDILPAKNKTHRVIVHLNKHLESMAATLLQYRADHFLCDSLVMVDDGELQAHSVILSAASPIFKAAFSLPNVPRCVRVSNVNMDVMKLALDAIYTGRIEYGDRSDVTELLVGFEVDISQLERGSTGNKLSTNKMKEECYDEPMICFDTIDKLKSEMGNIAELPVREMIGQPEHMMIGQLEQQMVGQLDEIIVSNLMDPVENQVDMNSPKKKSTKYKKRPSYNKPVGRICNCTSENSVTQCDALKPEQISQLQDAYSVFNKKQRDMTILSLVEVTRPSISQDDNPPVFKFWIPIEELCQPVRVCRRMFCGIFAIDRRTLRDVIKGSSKSKAVKSGGNSEAIQHSVKNANEPANKNKLCSCEPSASINQCNSIEPERLSLLQQEYNALCYRRQRLLLASMLDVMPPGIDGIQPVVRCWLPVGGETGRRIRVCRRMFCGVFSVNRRTLFDIIRRIATKKVVMDNIVDGRPVQHMALSASNQLETSEAEVNNIRNPCDDKLPEDTLPENAVAALQASECHCQQCQGRLDCAYCSSTFTNLKEMEQHRLEQHGREKERRLQVCDICQKMFSTRSSLGKHRINSHAKETDLQRVFLCPVCGKNFNNMNAMYSHVRIHRRKRKDKLQTVFVRREIKCNLCEEIFKRKLKYCDHMEQVHGVVVPNSFVFCDGCGKRLSSTKSLRRHKAQFCDARPDVIDERSDLH